MLCMNLCELPLNLIRDRSLFDQLSQKTEDLYQDRISRLYIGSSFCSQYFLHMPFLKEIKALCAVHKWKITLTAPVFSQKDLEQGKKTIQKLLLFYQEETDEITCNDPGMIKWIRDNLPKTEIHMGQLFFKDERDPRYSLVSGEQRRLSFPLPDGVKGIELSPVNTTLILPGPDQFSGCIAVHQPFCFISTGNICKFASVSMQPELKFRPNTACMQPCGNLFETYRVKGSDDPWYRFGRTIYMERIIRQFEGRKPDRIIYWPVKEVYQEVRVYESAGTSQST